MPSAIILTAGAVLAAVGALAAPGPKPWDQEGWKPTKDFSDKFQRDKEFTANWMECKHDKKKLQHPFYDEWCGKVRGNSDSAPGRASRGTSQTDQVCAPATFDKTLARKLAYAASAVYNVAPATDVSWPTGFTLLSTYASSGSDYGLLAKMPDGNLVLSFRGTNDISDWISNVYISAGDLKAGVEQTGAVLMPGVHSGFLGGFNGMRIQESCTLLFWCSQAHTPLYSALLNALGANPNAKVYITGHSRGGALASVAAMHLMYDTALNSYSAAANTALNSLRSRRDVHLYTFGEPRGLSMRGEATLDTSKLDAINKFRFTYYGDPVPGTPPSGVVEPSCWFDVNCDTWRHWGVAHRMWQDDPATTEAVSWGGDQYGLVATLENRCPNNNFPNTNADWSSHVWRHSMGDSYVQTWHRLSPITSLDLPKGWSLQSCLHTAGCQPSTRKAATCTSLAAGSTAQTNKCMVWPGTTLPTRFSVKPAATGITSYAPCTDASCLLPITSATKSGAAFTCQGPFRVVEAGVTQDLYILTRAAYTGELYPAAY